MSETHFDLCKRLDAEIAESRSKGEEPVLVISKAEEDLFKKEARYPTDEEPADTHLYKGVPVEVRDEPAYVHVVNTEELKDEPPKEDYGEPWQWNGERLLDRAGTPLQDSQGNLCIGDGKRIKACIDACAGIPAERLEQVLLLGKMLRAKMHDVTISTLHGEEVARYDIDDPDSVKEAAKALLKSKYIEHGFPVPSEEKVAESEEEASDV